MRAENPTLAFFALFVMVALALREAPAQTGAHSDGHAQAHDTYKGWHPPNNPGTSCCNNADCRPTRGRVNLNGEWEAWNGQHWLIVPWGRLLPPNFAGDGRSHICEKAGQIYCFTPGEIRG